MHSTFVVLALCLAVSAGPARFARVRMSRDAVDLQNGQDAIALNDQFKTLTADSACTAPQDACVDGQFAQCVGGKFSILGCAAGTTCGALPNVGTAGTVIACTTADDLAARIAATGATGADGGADGGNTDDGSADTGAAGGGAGNDDGATDNSGNGGAAGADGDPQTSLTLDSRVIAPGFANDGQDVPVNGQVPSLTSTNNFINFCLTVPDLPITDGKQITTGSCNPAPIGVIPSIDNMPSAKFVVPKNNDIFDVDTPFTITMAINNLETGNFVNAKENYFAAPQTVNGAGQIVGHSHVVVETLDSLTQTTPTNPKNFAFFKGINGVAVNGQVTADVTNGLPEGSYRVCSINSSSNHQPVIVPIAQHGSLDDCVYFTVGAAAAGGVADSS